jgi:hypothetical protein
MEVIILSKEQYDDMVIHIEVIKRMIIIQNLKENKDYFVRKQESHLLLNIGKRKRQIWKNVNTCIFVIRVIIEIWFCT